MNNGNNDQLDEKFVNNNFEGSYSVFNHSEERNTVRHNIVVKKSDHTFFEHNFDIFNDAGP